MFGYIRPLTAELKVGEYEFYKSIYCGLCKAMGKSTSCISRLTLSYDFVFLALCRMAIGHTCGKIVRERCIVHPAKRRAVMTDCDELTYCARVSAILTHAKIIDDCTDEKGFPKIGAYSLLPAAKHIHRKAVRKQSFDMLEKTIQTALSALSALEKADVRDPDVAADTFGHLLSAVCSYGYTGSEERIAAEIGRHIGRFIYLIDAVDDYEHDRKSGSYNPFADLTKEFSLDSQKENIRTSLTMELVGASRALELIDFTEQSAIGNILRNILYLGLPDLIHKKLESDNCNRKEFSDS